MADPATAQPSTSLLAPFLFEHYARLKALHPGEGRRKWRLRVLDAFWDLPAERKNAYLASISQNPPSIEAIEAADFTTDDDPLDDESGDAPGLGLLVRTDFTDEDAWSRLCAVIRDAEAEFAAVAVEEPSEGSSTDAADDTAMDEDESDDEDEEDEDDQAQDGTAHTPILHIINPPPSNPTARAALSGRSNLTLLRLLADADVRRAPAPPPGTRRVRPPSRLVDRDGWQETYAGKTLWVYDARSNADGCVRLVSGVGAAMYGTATGDSWRARASHVCELQAHLAAGALTIDFGGLDRWDYAERARNVAEAEAPVGAAVGL